MAIPGQPSGTYTWGAPSGGPPLISELVLDAYERCGKIGIELTSLMTQSARRSLNLVLSSWTNRGVNLWTVALFTEYMPAGQIEYVAPARVVDILADSVILRQYLMGAPVSVVPDFSTTSGSTSVTVSGLGATPSAGQYINVGVMSSIGGTILDGFYEVQSVPGSGKAIVTASAAATSTATGGTVPSFATTANSTTVGVTFNNHGLAIGQTFNVEVSTAVGGLTLLGPYAVATVANANQFSFNAPYPAGFSQTYAENGGLVQLSTQATQFGLTNTAQPVDIQLYPLSRTDYLTIPLKSQQGRPTSFWIDRQISPVIYVWTAPDGNGPYELRYMASQQVQDADIAGGQTMAIPFRFLEAFVADLAANLAQKWAPERAVALAQYAAQQWLQASTEDTEKVSLFMSGDLRGYYND